MEPRNTLELSRHENRIWIGPVAFEWWASVKAVPTIKRARRGKRFLTPSLEAEPLKSTRTCRVQKMRKQQIREASAAMVSPHMHRLQFPMGATDSLQRAHGDRLIPFEGCKKVDFLRFEIGRLHGMYAASRG